jgi:putative chitinase
MLDDAQLQKIMPALAAAKRQLYLPHLNAAMRASGIGTTMLRTAAFVAQLAHESGEFRWMEEIACSGRPTD